MTPFYSEGMNVMVGSGQGLPDDIEEAVRRVRTARVDALMDDETCPQHLKDWWEVARGGAPIHLPDAEFADWVESKE
jgi:hypothetical protein